MRKQLLAAAFGAAFLGCAVPRGTAESETDAQPAEAGEIKLPTAIKEIRIRKIMALERVSDAVEHAPYVVRRMTNSRFEVWQPTHGWLFDRDGQLVNEAVPPRRDGHGREWYGAFLPDGRWVTTDLWATDKTLTFFSAKGQWLRERSARQLAPAKEANHRHDNEYSDIIAWARCDRDGKGWVASIGTETGRAIIFVGPEGKARTLHGVTEPWKLCQPRDLEPKGWPGAWWCYRRRPSDDGQWLIRRAEYGHGEEIMQPPYQWGERTKVRWKDTYEEVKDDAHAVGGGNDNFGFLPGSHDVFIGASDYRENANTGRDDWRVNWTTQGRPFETRFFRASGAERGWLKGSYLADSADGQAMWFLDRDRGVVVLGNDLKVQSRMQFSMDGAAALPRHVFPDLRMGLFRVGEEFILGKW